MRRVRRRHAAVCILLILTCLSTGIAQKATKNVEITADDEKLRDPEGYEAVKRLHRQMDDDESGSIDRFESNDFLKEDMQLGGSDRERREKAFHHNNDEQITVDDLWEAWFTCEERLWTNAQVVAWLENSVRLSQYTSNIIASNIDGRALPRMAVTNSSYLSAMLGIKNAVHRHKIQLKALDLVLFGFTGSGSSRVKDIALSILLCILIGVLVLYKRQKSRSKQEMDQLSSKLKQLKVMESDFDDVQHKFEEERRKRLSVSDAIVAENEQVETLRSQLIEAERLLENSGSAPLAMQPLLRRTCELEMSYVGQQRLECIAEMREAIELIDKLRKKQSSLMSSIKLATGGSTGTDQVDSRIFSLKARMEKISVAMEECQQRWVEIESLCGFPLMVQPSGAELTFMGHTLPGGSGSQLARTSSACSSFYRTSGASSSSSGASTQSGASTVHSMHGSTRSSLPPSNSEHQSISTTVSSHLPTVSQHQTTVSQHQTTVPSSIPHHANHTNHTIPNPSHHAYASLQRPSHMSQMAHIIPPGSFNRTSHHQSSPQLFRTLEDSSSKTAPPHHHRAALDATMYASQAPTNHTGAAAPLPIKRELISGVSKGSLVSNDSIENEKENGSSLRKSSDSNRSFDGFKKSKFALLFRRKKVPTS